MILLDGKQTANDIKEEIAIEVSSLLNNGGKKPHLAAILVGNDGASETYVNGLPRYRQRILECLPISPIQNAIKFILLSGL